MMPAVALAPHRYQVSAWQNGKNDQLSITKNFLKRNEEIGKSVFTSTISRRRHFFTKYVESDQNQIATAHFRFL